MKFIYIKKEYSSNSKESINPGIRPKLPTQFTYIWFVRKAVKCIWFVRLHAGGM